MSQAYKKLAETWEFLLVQSCNQFFHVVPRAICFVCCKIAPILYPSAHQQSPTLTMLFCASSTKIHGTGKSRVIISFWLHPSNIGFGGLKMNTKKTEVMALFVKIRPSTHFLRIGQLMENLWNMSPSLLIWAPQLHRTANLIIRKL